MRRFTAFLFLTLSLGSLAQVPQLQSGSAPATVTFSVSGKPTTAGTWTGTVQPSLPLSPNPFPRPGGTITFFDGSTAVNPGGAALTAGAGHMSAPFSDPFGTGANPLATWQGVAGDFNRDGVPDLLIYSTDSISNTLLLQVFEGHTAQFAALPQQSLAFSPQSYPSSAAVLDVDGDGKLDLLIGNTVAYGNGDGTFSRVAVLPALATGFNQTYAVDVNGDGKPDIVAVDTPPTASDSGPAVQFTFTVFRNDGSGTFTSLGSFPLAAPAQPGQNLCCGMYNIFGLSFADVNGDGKVDVLSQSSWVPIGQVAFANNLNVMLNNGDGTFGAVKPVDVSALSSLQTDGVAFGDINGDGKLDLVLAYANSDGLNFLGAALGNGDGSFGAFSQLKLIDLLTAAIPNPQVQLADFNVNGKLDAILGSGELALGNGDGTFTLSTPLFPQPANPQTPLNYPLLQIPIYTTTLPSLVYLNFTNTNAVFTPLVSSSATFTPVLSAGTHVITVHYSGDSTYAASVSSPATIMVYATMLTMTLTSSANPIYAGQSVTFTATLNDPAATGTVTFLDAYPGSDPLQPILSPNPTTLGTASVVNGVATLTTNQLPSGTHTITAVDGDVNNPGATAQFTEKVNMLFSVANSAQEISLSVAPGMSASSQLSISALGGFSGPVKFDCRNGDVVCSFSPATVNLTGTSASTVTLTVTATHAPTTAQASAIFGNTILLCGVPLFALFGIASAGRPRALFAVIAIALCGISCLGCGGGGQQQASSASLPAGTYPFYVTATSGQNELAINAVLTVQ